MNYWVGIDQTGALDKSGRPKKLPACSINSVGQIQFFYLEQLSKVSFFNNIKDYSTADIKIAVDCVLGLPIDLNLDWSAVINQIIQTQGYGKKVAQEFYTQLAQGLIYKRQAEILLKAQSVFQDKPFQRNIQTGTFRLWKEYAKSRSDFYIPSLERAQSSQQIPLYEGYPTLAWKILFKVKKREPQNLVNLLNLSSYELRIDNNQEKQILNDFNLADAFVLALLLKTTDPKKLPQNPSKEGHILGADYITG